MKKGGIFGLFGRETTEVTAGIDINVEKNPITTPQQKQAIQERAAASQQPLTIQQQENIFRKMMSAKAGWMDFIGISFLSDDFKERLMTIIEQRFKRII